MGTDERDLLRFQHNMAGIVAKKEGKPTRAVKLLMSKFARKMLVNIGFVKILRLIKRGGLKQTARLLPPRGFGQIIGRGGRLFAGQAQISQIEMINVGDG